MSRSHLHQLPRWMLLSLLLSCASKGETTAPATPRDDTPADSLPGQDPLPCEEVALDPACCPPSQDSLFACTDGLPDASGSGVLGAFASVAHDPARWLFVPDDKNDDSFTLLFQGTRVADVLPDLSTLGTVRVRDGGGCSLDGEGFTGGVFEVRDAQSGFPLVMVGTGSLQPERAEGDKGLTVTWGQTLGEECPERAGNACAEHLASHAVKVSYGGGSVLLYQGQEATLNGLRILIFRAEAGRGELFCDDATGGGENWAVVAVDSTMAR